MYKLLPLSLLAFASLCHCRDSQFVLGRPSGPFRGTSEASGDNWFAREQYDAVCEAGSRHFAGRVNVTDDKSIFFCQFAVDIQ